MSIYTQLTIWQRIEIVTNLFNEGLADEKQCQELLDRWTDAQLIELADLAEYQIAN